MAIQYLIHLIAHLTTNMSYFVVLILHVSAPIGHLQEGNLQQNTFVTSVAQGVHT